MKKRVIISMVATLALSLSVAFNVQAGKITQSQNEKFGLVDINAHAEGETTRPH